MSDLNKTISIIEQARTESEAAWDQAIDSAREVGETDRTESFTEMALECDKHYEQAIRALTEAYEGYDRVARNRLNDAESLERKGGDSQHAKNALEALDALVF